MPPSPLSFLNCFLRPLQIQSPHSISIYFSSENYLSPLKTHFANWSHPVFFKTEALTACHRRPCFPIGIQIIKDSIINQTYPTKISPNPSFSKRGTPPFCKGREGGI